MKRIFITIGIIVILGALAGLVGYKLFVVGKDKGDIARKIIQTIPSVRENPKVELLSELLGFAKPKRYLVMFQNSTEIRPTGGFFGSYGLITVANGKIISAAYGDPYTLDKKVDPKTRPPSPAPIAKYMGIQKWYLRDANWDPDFPTSAARVYQFWVEEGGEPNIDGVIAITSHLLPALLKLTGPVTVPPGITFRAETVVDELEEEVEYRWASRGVTWENRKAMVGELGQALTNKIHNVSPIDWPRLVALGQTLLREGDITLWLRDPSLQRRISSERWDGAVRPGTSDFLMVVDANLSALKTDPVVRRFVRYEVWYGSNGQVTLTYEHEGNFTWKTTRYRSYTRVLAPKGSTVIQYKGYTQGDWDIIEGQNYTSFGKFFTVEPGKQTRLYLEYRLPQTVLDQRVRGTYHLETQQQVGASREFTVGPEPLGPEYIP